jgi:uncharacterized protein YkwD
MSAENRTHRAPRTRVVRVALLLGGLMSINLATTAPSTAANAAEAQSPEWLTVVNLYRASAGLSSVTENAEASAGAIKHSAYLLRNNIIGHDEDPKDPGYSAEGKRAGLTGNVATGYGRLPGQRATIEEWMTAPFHGLGMLSPDSKNFGYGLVGTKKGWASTLSVFWDDYSDPDATGNGTGSIEAGYQAVLAKYPELKNRGYSGESRGARVVIEIDGRRFSVVDGVVTELAPASPGDANPSNGAPTVVWPGNGTSVPVMRYYGGEWPDPMTSCKGFGNKVGLPLLIRRGRPTEIASASLTDATGVAQTLCTVTAETYRNPNAKDQEYASYILSGGEAFIVPKAPLMPGKSYRAVVDLTDGEHLDWTFSISTDANIHLPDGHPLAGQVTPGTPSQTGTKPPTKTPAKKKK